MLGILLLLSIFSLLFVGVLFLRLLGLLKKFSIFELLPLAYGLGIGCVCLQMFFYSQISLPLNYLAIISPWVVLYVLKPFKLDHAIRIQNIGKVEAVLTVFIFMLIVFVWFEALIRPLMSWDGIATWLIKSKVFFIEGEVRPQTLIYLNDGYPILIGLAGTFIYKTLGVVNDRLVLVLFYGYYLSCGSLAFAQLRRVLNLKYSLFLTFLFFSIQNIIRHGGRYETGYADLAFGFYILTAITILFRVLSEKKMNMFVLFVMILGIVPVVKEEGVVFSIVMSFVVLFFVMKKALPTKFLYVLFLWTVPFLDWRLYKFFYHIPTNYLFKNPQFVPSRFPITILLMVKEFFNVKNWNLLWITYIVSLFLYKKNGKVIVIFSVVMAMMGSYFVVYLISPNQPSSHIPNTIDRLLLHFAPLAIVSLGYSLSNLNIGVKKRIS